MSGARTDGALGDTQSVVGAGVPNEQILGGATSYPKLLFLLFLLTLPLLNPWVRGDGIGYYSYLRSPLIDHDFNFENEYRAGKGPYVVSRFDANGHLRPENYT